MVRLQQPAHSWAWHFAEARMFAGLSRRVQTIFTADAGCVSVSVKGPYSAATAHLRYLRLWAGNMSGAMENGHDEGDEDEADQGTKVSSAVSQPVCMSRSPDTRRTASEACICLQATSQGLTKRLRMRAMRLTTAPRRQPRQPPSGRLSCDRITSAWCRQSRLPRQRVPLHLADWLVPHAEVSLAEMVKQPACVTGCTQYLQKAA